MAVPPTGFEEADLAAQMGRCTKEHAEKAKKIALARACRGDNFNFHDAMQILREKGWLNGGNDGVEDASADTVSEETNAPTLRQRQVKHLTIGLFLYTVFAALDAVLTLKGTAGNMALEGNPVIRAMMASFGPVLGLALEKSMVAILASLLTVIVLRGIHYRREWVYLLALTPMTRRWMQRKRRYWIAYLPIYATAIAQGLAAGSWYYLLYILQKPG